MSVTSRIIALIIALSVITTTSMFAYGIYTETLEQYVSFDIAAQIAKFTLTLGMLIIAFFARPRSAINRIILGSISTLVIGSATVHALTGTLLTGDAIIMVVGVLVAAFESVEATLPQHRNTVMSMSSRMDKLPHHKAS